MIPLLPKSGTLISGGTRVIFLHGPVPQVGSIGFAPLDIKQRGAVPAAPRSHFRTNQGLAESARAMEPRGDSGGKIFKPEGIPVVDFPGHRYGAMRRNQG